MAVFSLSAMANRGPVRDTGAVGVDGLREVFDALSHLTPTAKIFVEPASTKRMSRPIPIEPA